MSSVMSFRRLRTWLLKNRRIPRSIFINRVPDRVRVKGMEIFLNTEDTLLCKHIALYHQYEPSHTKLIEHLIRSDSHFVDVGANIGWFSLLAASRGASVSSFEPEPTSFNLLRKSARVNKYQNLKAFPYAILDYDGTVRLSVSDSYNKGTHSTVRKVGQSYVEVSCKTLDSLFPDSIIDILKVDVEGAETKVLRGASRLIGQGKIHHIIMELNPEDYDDIDLLHSIGAKYSLLDIHTGRKMAKFPNRTSDVHLVLK